MRAALLWPLLAAWLPLAAAAPPADAPGMRLYRYTDSRGVTVLDTQGVPPEYVAKGYQVLNQQGRVIQTVPPAPTADELKTRQARQAQQDADQALLQRYRSLDDLDREKARRLAEADAQAGLASNNLAVLRQQQNSLQAQAADMERNGQPVADVLVRQLAAISKQQADVSQQIAGYKQARAVLAAQFDQDRLRLQTLLP